MMAKLVVLILPTVGLIWFCVSQAFANPLESAVLIHVTKGFVVLVARMAPLVVVHLTVAVVTPECWIGWCILIIVSDPVCSPVNTCHLAHLAIPPVTRSLNAWTDTLCTRISGKLHLLHSST